jgi:DNA-binding response OmpR family regulator
MYESQMLTTWWQDDVTTKPYRMDELAAQIERMVSRVEREDVDVG